ncbi:TPA: hypothetical protein RXK74_004609 [Escherichia coli]|nr:hypothetical protein [Escherichia coli]
MSNATGRVGQQVNAVTGIFMNPVFSVSCSAQGDKNRHFLMYAVAAVCYVKSDKKAGGKEKIFHVVSDKVTIDI